MGLNSHEGDVDNSTKKGLSDLKRVYGDLVDNIVFRQERVGKDGKVFTAYKIRTMGYEAEHDIPANVLEGNKDPNDLRIIPSRKWMRRSGIDEIPQLFNILKGDMSLFGARPMDMNTFQQLSESQKGRRNDFKPGIFGGYALYNKGKGFREKGGRYRPRTNRENQDVYLRLKRIKESKGLSETVRFNTWILVENVRALLNGVNR